MARLLGRKLVCFYCNCRSVQSARSGIKQWQCERCDAVNHLDENGEITDPPTFESIEPARFAQPRPRSQSPRFEHQESSLFCNRCIQNQHIAAQALAEYLPPQDDPRYVEFEKNIKNYEKSLAQRFPPVCDKCAPAVENRIRATGYAAKTDHLRRLMDRTRGASPTYIGWDWKNLLVTLAGIGWLASLSGQIFWHVHGALEDIEPVDGLLDEAETRSLAACLLQVSTAWLSSRECDKLLHRSIRYAQIFGLLCFWWNPKMQHKLSGKSGRIIGQAEFYLIQAILLTARFLGWKLLTEESAFFFDRQLQRAIHALLLVLIVVLTVTSFRIIQIDKRPIVSFQDTYEPLVPASRQMEPTSASQGPNGGNRQLSKTRFEPFPIDKLASRPQPPPYQAPTPPPEEEDEFFGMDWTPQHNFRPAQTYNRLQTKPHIEEPSPFHGVLPPAPVSWAQRLRNPSQPTFVKASETRKESFFSKKNHRFDIDVASDNSSQNSPTSTAFASVVGSPIKFAPPKFFAPSDRMETGLEDLFNDARLDSEPAVIQRTREQKANELSKIHKTSSKTSRAVTGLLLLTSCVAWDYAPKFASREDQVRCITLAVSALAAACNLWSSVAKSKPQRSMGVLLVYLVEIAASLFLAGILYVSVSDARSGNFNPIGLWFLIGMTVQEIWIFITGIASRQDILVPAASQPAEAPSNQRDTPREHLTEYPVTLPVKRRNEAPVTTMSSARLRSAKPNRVELSQRTTRSKALTKPTRDSLGVDAFGSLSLGAF